MLERLRDGDSIIIAEGFMWECERRGYLSLGAFIPEVILENPGLVKGIHEEYVHAGTDVVEAFTYYGHRSKLRKIGREDDLEKLNRTALRIAREVADASGKLMAGALCGTHEYKEGDAKAIAEVKAMFKELIEWSVEEKADFIIAETFATLGEAMLALEAIKEYGEGLPAVITITPHVPDHTYDNVPLAEACLKLENAGADVVGLNCARGPETMLPLLREIRALCKGPVAALPVPFRTNNECKTFQGVLLQYLDLNCVMCSRSDVRRFAQEAKELGVNYIGLCCGNAPNYLREIAEVYGRKPPASKYAPDIQKNPAFEDDANNSWQNGGSVLVAEGILWECERRGYLSFGKYLPEVLLDNPSVVKTIHEEFVHAGTDVVEAFTYFAIRTKLRQYGLEDQLEKMNRTALKMAREVANTSGKLMAGAEMVEWSVEEGADYIIGLPAVITFAAHDPDSTIDNVPLPEACRRMEEAGADVVGLNCVRGKLLAYVDAACKMCSRSDIREFAEAAKEMGINYIGLCCGNAPNYFREIAEVYDRKPPASTYRPNFEQAKIFTDNPDPEWYKFIVGLLERLQDGDSIIIAEGFMWECERRDYLSLGAFIPEVILENPGLYYGHRSKLRKIGREDDLEKLNRTALRIAREVADASGKLMAGALCGTHEYKEGDRLRDGDSIIIAEGFMWECERRDYLSLGAFIPDVILLRLTGIYFLRTQELIEWSVEEKADFIIAETFATLGEAMLALEAIKEYGKGLPAVITITPHVPDHTYDNVPLAEACLKLENAGAAVVGLNCARGPETMGPVAALPVPFRTNNECKTFQGLKDPKTDELLQYLDLNCVMCSRSDVRRFAQDAKELGVNYIGLCCGNAPNYLREIAEVYGRLVERLRDGDSIIIAEGFMWECERRGYLSLGAFIPEVILENPELVKGIHEEYVHAGTDIVEAFTYYGHRSKLRKIGREDDLEKLNRTALRIAREVADASGKLMAGALCGTHEYKKGDAKAIAEVKAMFKELIEWSVEEKADFIIAETFATLGEAMLALEAIKEYGKGLPAVITITPHVPDHTYDNVPLAEACLKLENAGAAVVGLNCARGPETMLPLLREIRALCKYLDLNCVMCSRSDVRRFAQEAKELGVNYIGLCCGNAPNYLREIAEVYGRKPPASCVLVAEGILWECERRGYLSFGKYLPEVLLDNPSVVKTIHEEFVHAGTDVVEAFTYFALRTKLRQYGLEDQLEKMNRTALKMAREVADTSGKLMAGAEMVEWSVEEGADYIIGLPAVITFAAHDPDSTIDNVPLPEACRRMEEAGADVVGLNCVRGPKSMLPLLQEIKNVCKFKNAKMRFFDLGKLLAYVDAACKMCSRSDIREFAEAAKEMGINYIGLCCRNAPNYFREIAEVYDRKPPASTYRPNFEQAKIFTDNPDPEWYKFIV
ncbi:hypothetical protein KUTeg_007119, partial [Tegillarca granosa]